MVPVPEIPDWQGRPVGSIQPGKGAGRARPRIRRRAVPQEGGAVRKAALSSPGERPRAADHRRAIAVESVVALDKAIPVDYTVTTDATLMGAAEKMRSAFPGVEVAAFAAMRTAGFQNIKKTRDSKVEAATGTQAARRSVDREGARAPGHGARRPAPADSKVYGGSGGFPARDHARRRRCYCYYRRRRRRSPRRLPFRARCGALARRRRDRRRRRRGHATQRRSARGAHED